MTTSNVLEDALDRVFQLPVDTKRLLALLRDLDAKSAKDADALERLQAEHLELLRAGAAADPDRVEAVASGLAAAKRRLDQKLEERVAIAQQQHEVADRHVERLTRDAQALESELRHSGELDDRMEEVEVALPPQDALLPGALVAAATTTDESSEPPLWILARVVEATGRDRVVVADADPENTESRYTLSRKNIVVLAGEGEEDVVQARARLGPRGRRVMAIYPDTTSFYPATLSSLPQVTPADSRDSQFAGKLSCVVQFNDDEDVSGKNPKRTVLCKHAFVL